MNRLLYAERQLTVKHDLQYNDQRANFVKIQVNFAEVSLKQYIKGENLVELCNLIRFVCETTSKREMIFVCYNRDINFHSNPNHSISCI